MKESPKVCVVILNWNGLEFLKRFLPSVRATTYANLEIVIGDNASTDGSVSFVKEQYPEFTLIENSRNLGFAGGYNKVLNQVNGDYLVLLNSDVEVSPDWIQPVISLMEKDRMIAAAQPKVLSLVNREYFEHAGASGGFIDLFGYPFCRGRIFDTVEQDCGQYEDEKEVFWASGAAFFIRKSVWEEAGGFDEDFFAHMEEIDLCWRLKNKGYKIYCCPESSVYHLGGGTLNAEHPYKTYLNFRNNLVLLQKNLSFLRASAIIFIRLWLDLITWIKFITEGKYKNALAINRAHTYFFKNILNTSRKAKTINISRFNEVGLYKSSIVWGYFVRKKKTFGNLK